MTQPPIHRRHVTCHRHPTKPVTGFCASCLRERLSGIDPDTHIETPLTRLSSELRRSKSAAAEPRRRSCDVRVRNSLSDLFDVENGKGKVSKGEVKFKGLGFDLGVEIREIGDEIRVSKEDGFDGDGEFRTMKEFIELEWEKKRGNSYVGRGFWEVASSISRKLGKWKIKEKKGNGVKDKDVGKVENEERRSLGGFGRIGKLRETQSEVGEYGFGRRSCDMDPRLSVDACLGLRLSVDDSRWSFEEPRASWDGCLSGNGRLYHQHSKLVPPPPPLVSVMEDVKVGGGERVKEKEGNVGLENGGNESCCPGGTMQTRDYYCSGRRRSFDRFDRFDRSMPVKRVGLGEDELKSMWNAKVSPETVGLFHGAKLLVTEKELRNSNWYADKDSRGGAVDSVSKDIGSVAVGTSKKDMGLKRTQRWCRVWNVWGLVQRKREVKCGDEESSVAGNVIDGPIEESLQKLRGMANGMGNGAVSQKLIQSYTVSTRDSSKMACTSCSGFEDKDNGTKRKEEIMLHRSRSIRYSPNNVDNGLLRFYLTPQRTYGRSRSGKSRLNNPLSFARDVL